MAYVYGRSPQQTQEERRVSEFKVRIACNGKFEIILHLACIVMVCVASLIPAAIAIETTNEIKEYIDSIGGTLYSTDGRFDADGSRAAAGWLVFVCCVGIVFHFVGIVFYINYLNTGVIKHMISYSVVVIVVTIILGLGFLAGSVANGIQVASTASLETDRCLFQFRHTDVCQNLGTLISCQLACTILPPASMVMYGLLLCPVCIGISTVSSENRRSRLSQSRSRPTTQSTSQPISPPTESVRPPPHIEMLPSAPPHSQIVSSAPSSNTQTDEPPIVSEDASPSASKCQPPYESTFIEPPPYEVAITNTDV